MTKKICVIGAGPAGIFFALAAHQEGYQVELFESHSKPGGCASYFRRKTSVGTVAFDAGATVLWGMQHPEDLLSKFLKRLEISGLDFLRHNSISYRLSNKHNFTLDAQNTQAWLKSLEKAFPNETPDLWKGLEKLRVQAEKLQEILLLGVHIPFDNISCIKFNLPHIFKLMPLLCSYITGNYKSFESLLISWKASKEFMEWVNMTLLISLQSKSDNVHPLYGALALFFYPMGSGSVQGGMAHFFDSLRKALSEKIPVYMREEVKKIVKEKTKFFIQTKDTHGPYDIVVSSIPRFNTQELIGEKQIDNFAWEKSKGQLWSAIVGYLLVRDSAELKEAPFNHHSTNSSGQHFYYSWSARNDSLRTPSGYRAVTFSFHTPLGEWREHAEYADYKQEKGFAGLALFMEDFPHNEIVFHEYGTPKTFFRYTKRKEGCVGGLPLNYQYTFLKSPSSVTQIPGLYQIGDTSFPGQSIFGCAVGSLLCLEKIANKKIISKL